MWTTSTYGNIAVTILNATTPVQVNRKTLSVFYERMGASFLPFSLSLFPLPLSLSLLSFSLYPSILFSLNAYIISPRYFKSLFARRIYMWFTSRNSLSSRNISRNDEWLSCSINNVIFEHEEINRLSNAIFGSWTHPCEM